MSASPPSSVDVATGSQLWAERYDRDLADVFAVQDEITEAIVAAIEPQLYAAENFRARRKTPDNMDAWDLVMRALSHYWRVTRQDNLVAQALLEKAIAIDPELRPGARRAGRQPHVQRPYGLGRHGDRRCRRPNARRWRRSGPTARTRGRIMRSASVYLFDRRFDDSLAEYELALRLNPNFSLARGYLRRGAVLSRPLGGGRPRRARGAAILARAIRLSRSIAASPPIASIVGSNYAEAIRLSREAHAPAHRFRRRPPRADRRRRHGRRRRTPPDRRCGNCAAPSPTSRWPGSPATCRSSTTRTRRIIWKDFGARGCDSFVPRILKRELDGKSCAA